MLRTFSRRHRICASPGGMAMMRMYRGCWGMGRVFVYRKIVNTKSVYELYKASRYTEARVVSETTPEPELSCDASREPAGTSAEAFKKRGRPPKTASRQIPKRPVSHLHPQYGTFVSYRELCASKGQSNCGRLNYLDRCKLATSKLIVSGYHSCWGAARGDRGNERLSLFLPTLQDGLRNRPPPYSTAGRAHLRGVPARASDC